MLRTVPRALFVIGVVVAATTAGCGADKAQTCKNIEQEIQSLQAGMKEITDLQALSNTFRESATKIRNEGESVGGDVENASGEAATALEQLADRLSQGAKPEQAEVASLRQAGPKIQSACA
ncbi:MAG: hypothetical protein ACRDTG_30950 [Pseudonocardiaceae bacterium]